MTRPGEKQEQELTINKMVSDSYRIAEVHGWHERSTSVAERLCLTHSEVSEALEDYRCGREVNVIYYEDLKVNHSKPCGIPIELADVIIRIADFCGVYKVDLEEAIRVKQKYNENRPRLHGGKKL